MKRLPLLPLLALVAACHVDDLFQGPGGGASPSPPPPPAATHLVFTMQPSDAFPGAAIQPPVEVTALDAQDDPVTRFAGDVTIAIGQNAGVLARGTLSGRKTVAAVGGVARFSDLSIDQPGVGYTLRATGSGLAGAESTSFTILVP